MKVFVAFAGPRMKGNTSVLLNSYIEGIKSVKPDAEIIDGKINTKKINYCMGCNACKKDAESFCIQKDDMVEMYDDIGASDVIIMAGPTYWFNIAAQLKTFLDRLYGLKSGAIGNKTFVYITTFEDVDVNASGAHNAINAMKEACEYIGNKFDTVYASTGEMLVAENEEAKKMAFDKGAALAKSMK